MPPKGLQACATGYMMTPVSFSHVAQIVRLECPIYHPITVDTKSDNNSGRQARDSTYDDVYSRQILGYPYTKAADNGWTVTDLLHSKQCQPYFTILPSSISSELYVRADLEELVGSSITSSTQWALYYAHTVKVHPDDPAFLVECARLKVTVPCQMRTEPSAFAAPEADIYVVDTEELSQTVWHIASRTRLIGVDCEGCSLSRHGKLCIVQVFAAGKCYIYDMLDANEDVVFFLGNIIKVMHDCRQDSAALMYQENIKLQSIFDTQVAHGLLEYSACFGSKQQHTTTRIGLQRLLSRYNLPVSKYISDIKDMMSRDNTMWGKRSITQFLLEGAAEDVSQLLPLAEEMASHLGSIWVGHVIALSDSYSQTHWDASDKEPATHGMTVLPTLAPWLSKLHVKIPDQEDYKHDDYLAGTTD